MRSDNDSSGHHIAGYNIVSVFVPEHPEIAQYISRAMHRIYINTAAAANANIYAFRREVDSSSTVA